MPSKKGTPTWWYPVNIVIGIAAAYYARFYGTQTGKDNLTEYGVTALVGGVVLVIAGMKQQRRNLAPLGVFAITFGLAALLLV